MKRFIALAVAVIFIAMSFVATPVYAQDSMIDKAGDWWATRGKKEPEKTMILASRRAERAAKRAEKAMREQSKKMEKSMKEMFGK